MGAGIRLVRRDCGGEEEGDDATSGSGAAGGTSQLRRCTVILWQLRAVMPEPSQTLWFMEMQKTDRNYF